MNILLILKLLIIPLSVMISDSQAQMVKVTAYTARVCETDSTPTITASNKRVREGYVALSRDLEKRYNLRFGDRVLIKKIGIFEFQDRMHRRKKRQVDIYMNSLSKAKEFGVKRGELLIWKRGRK